MAKARVHQHVNPLAKYFRELPVEPLNAADVYEHSDNPLHIDIGCGRGRFLLKMAKENPEWNFLGLEIRERLVIEANKRREDQGLQNLHYVFCNAPLDLGVLLSKTPRKLVQKISIQFPDPWFKKRHVKRRMVNEQLVEYIDSNLKDNGLVYVQTDVAELFEDMSDHFEKGGFTEEPAENYLLPVKTEREISVENRKLEVYRAVYRR